MDGNPGTAASRNSAGRDDGTRAGEHPLAFPSLQPVIDLRGAAYRLAGFSFSLTVPSTAPLASPARSVRALREAVDVASGADLFVSLDGVAGTAAATVLPAILNGAEDAGIVLSCLVVDLGGPFPEPLAGDDILEMIESTRGRGVRVSISRAGLSESGLEMLLGTRPDFLRIAASLVSGCGDDFYRQAIVETISGLAWKFGASVLAEGVVDQRDARWLAGAGVTLGQGPAFGGPLGPAALQAFLLEPSLPFDPRLVRADGRPETAPSGLRPSQEEP